MDAFLLILDPAHSGSFSMARQEIVFSTSERSPMQGIWRTRGFYSMTLEELIFSDANFVMHFDGGARGSSCSAATWIPEAHVRHRGEIVSWTAAMSGTFLLTPVSSFLSELSALESCTAFLTEMAAKMLPERSACKRARCV